MEEEFEFFIEVWNELYSTSYSPNDKLYNSFLEAIEKNHNIDDLILSAKNRKDFVINDDWYIERPHLQGSIYNFFDKSNYERFLYKKKRDTKPFNFKI